MATAIAPAISPADVWSPDDCLSVRVKQLRDQYWNFYQRAYTNEVRAFTTGTPWDQVYARWNWTNVPEMMMFLNGAQAYLLADARRVEVEPDFWREPLVVRRALFFKRVVAQFLPTEILPGELVVGSHFCTALSFCLTAAESKKWQRTEQQFVDRVEHLDGVGIGNCGAVPGHLIPDYARVVTHGWKDIDAQAATILAAPDTTPTQRDFARAIRICGEAVRNFADRYASEAQRLADQELDPERKAELLTLAEICRHVPWEPATTFHQALQSLFLTHILVLISESYPGPGVSPGRIDQYLYPYFAADQKAGRLTRDQAEELLQCLWIKFNYAYDYQGWTGTNQGINSSFGQLITLGGIDAEGKDASNELTFLILDVIESMNLLEPKPNVRLHQDTPNPLLDRLVEMIAKAQGSPFLLNFDESSMAGLRWQGAPEADLWNYAPVGCLENTLQGCDRSGTVDVNLNLAKAIELVFHDGRDAHTGEPLGPHTGDPNRFQSFDDFWRAYQRQLGALIDRLIGANNLADQGRAEFAPTPYLSGLVDGCLKSGRDVTGGGAEQSFITVEAVGLATTVDSLAAVRELVFSRRTVSMAQLKTALDQNFEGHEPLRQTLLHKAPKFGNGDEATDQLAHQLNDWWTRQVFEQRSPQTGKRYRGGYLSWNYWVAYAPKTAATPNGRSRGQYLSNGVCPSVGADQLGPTAAIRSVGALGLETAPNGASQTMSLPPALLKTPEGRQKIAALLRAYGKIGGTCLQLNVIDSGTLKAAQSDPDSYRNLLVRVTGYNAYFVMLGKEIQDEIIARESHGL